MNPSLPILLGLAPASRLIATTLDLPTVEGPTLVFGQSGRRSATRKMQMNPFKTLQAAVMLLAMANPAMAQSAPSSTTPMKSSTPMAPMSGMPVASGSAADANPSTKAFKAADEKMMRDMDHPMTGNADQDFVAGMLPHHVGAVDMAKVELQYGKDPEMLKLARAIIAAQEKEIAQMQAWQVRHPLH
jgi:uncharacterized protein (DUF305 family)